MNFGVNGVTQYLNKDAIGKAWANSRQPLSTATIKGHNVGAVLQKGSNKLGDVIIRQGTKAGAESVTEAVAAGSKTFLGRLAGLGKKFLGKIGATPKGNYIIGAIFEAPTWFKNIMNGKGVVSQTVHSGSKVVGGAVGWSAGVAAGAGLAAWGAGIGTAFCPLAGTLIGGAIGFGAGLLGGYLGWTAGDIVGGKAAEGIRGASNIVFGSNNNDTEPVQQHAAAQTGHTAQAGEESDDAYIRQHLLHMQQVQQMYNNPFIMEQVIAKRAREVKTH